MAQPDLLLQVAYRSALLAAQAQWSLDHFASAKPSAQESFWREPAYYVKIEDRPLIVEEIEDWRRIHSVELFRLRRDAEKTAIEERAGLKEAGVEQVLLLSEQDSCKLTLLDKFVS